MVVMVVIFRPAENNAQAKSFFDAGAVMPWQVVLSALIPKIAVRRRAALLWLVVRWAATETSHARPITCMWIA